MEFNLNFDTWRDLARRAREAAIDAADTLRDGMEYAGDKLDAAREQLRLRRAIQELVDEIELQMAAIGELIYATHKGQPSDSGDVDEILNYVDGLYQELEGYRARLNKLKGVLVCHACGAENAPENFYCHNCGRPLDVETV